MESKSRIHVIDSLRGFALLGILFIHMLMFFLAGPFTPEINAMAVQSSLDKALRAAIYWIALSKFYSIFSVLFGLGFYIQMRNGRKKLKNFHLRFLWRMVILAGFGFLHWTYYAGDILVLYAVIGIILLLLSFLSDKALLLLAILLFAGLGRILFFTIDADGSLFSYDWSVLYGNFTNAALNGSFFDVAQSSYARMVMFWDEHFNLWGRFYNTLSYFIFGLLLGRLSWLEDLDFHIAKFKIAFVVSLCGAVLFGGLHLKFIGGAWELFIHPHDVWFIVTQYSIFDFYSISLSTCYASGFILAANHFKNGRIFLYLSSYGRMALTSFLTQSALGTFIFFNWGLGLIHELSVSACLIVFLIVAVAQITFSHFWLKHFRYGPLEWLWRSLTYFEWMPNKK